MAVTELENEGICYRLRPIKNVGLFVGRSYLRLDLDSSDLYCIRISNISTDDGMLSSFVGQSLKSYGRFSDLEVEIALSHRWIWSFRTNTAFGVGSSTARRTVVSWFRCIIYHSSNFHIEAPLQVLSRLWSRSTMDLGAIEVYYYYYYKYMLFYLRVR